METEQARLGRLRLRSMRRGTREMDLILGGFADSALAQMSDEELAAYDALLEENDHDLYGWIIGLEPAPAHHAPLITRIAAAAMDAAARAAAGT